MNLDPQACYRALKSRDRRFDGRFFTGVTSTGIYCRPVCPARTPLSRHCRFFASSAAALEAGFRPCLRCRPELAPRVDPLDAAPMLSQALELISNGFLDEASVQELAGRLSVGERQLRRLFVRELGVSPQRVAAARRLDFARQLLRETRLSVLEVAMASGFSSLRRFNEAFLQAYRLPPSGLRRERTGDPEPEAGPALLRLPCSLPYDWQEVLAYYRRRLLPEQEQIRGTSYLRTVRVEGEPGWVEVCPAGEGLAVRLHVPRVGLLLPALERLKLMLDVAAPVHDVAEHLARDPLLAARMGPVGGLRLCGHWELYETAVRAVLGQRIRVEAAATLGNRLVAALGEEGVGPLPRLFPRPRAVLGAGEEGLAALGIGGPAARTLLELSRLAAEQSGWENRLEQVPGVGPWTLEYFALRARARPDAFPASDLGLRKALGGAGRPAAPREVEHRARAWSPWRAYAAVILWREPLCKCLN